ncbi:MAG: lipopolysaccharide heptosyltransferase II [Candidatus Omnitrophica bacterium CG08_land_8_20_14_0_20_41_16]|uniref:lipopolysaccharide heptosyltransferase II n=1 Tax=Candidatus Sherwoodlollariibacterium unditelluris TaxID=1974757 RepID=A0A2G9YKZ6_9BACT|nr:MAG: lipopolysaccharide heptosyltransferase II [Candidatus Omnitrophica bacterium CG23_combo_of_CG06-09_8_20_14_all_41_10]PIS33922.1 MAG: lipopolysaccharide heptosyltransferase II [Candidatus Omnitrophica bacterium CG08_land_8_20_14_0_20_41_16]
MREQGNKRILIFNVNWLGDVLFSTATIRNIRRNFPDSFIACIVPSRCYPILKGNPNLDELIIFDEKDRHKGILERFDFVRSLRGRSFDIVFLLHRSFSRALICRLAGIPERIGYYTRKRGFLLTRKIIPPPKDSLHRIDYYLDIIKKAGLKVEDRYTEFYITDEDIKFAREFLNKNLVSNKDLLVVINPGGNWLPKRWPKEYWAELADKLIEGFGAKVVVTGGYNDLSLTSEIKSRMKFKPIIACGVFNLKQLGALIKEAGIFITVDTGPLHIANSVGAKKIIAIFGPTSPKITGPYPLENVIILQKNVGCVIPCYEVKCKDNRCMKAITPNDVLKEIKTQ